MMDYNNVRPKADE